MIFEHQLVAFVVLPTAVVALALSHGRRITTAIKVRRRRRTTIHRLGRY